MNKMTVHGMMIRSNVRNSWWNCTASASAGLFPNDRRNQTQRAINLGWSYFWWSVGLDQIWGINFWIHVGERNQPILLQFHTNILLNAKLLNLAECNHPTAKDNISLLLNSGYRVLQSLLVLFHLSFLLLFLLLSLSSSPHLWFPVEPGGWWKNNFKS